MVSKRRPIHKEQNEQRGYRECASGRFTDSVKIDCRQESLHGESSNIFVVMF